MTKIPVAILGATGAVGQKFIELLYNHPWFEIVALAASDRSSHKLYGEAVHWTLPFPMPKEIATQRIVPCEPNISCKIVFSALSSDVAFDIEKQFASKGYLVVSNASAHRMEKRVPLIIPEVNGAHLAEAFKDKGSLRGIVTNPNCSVIGLTMALKPLADLFGLEKVHVVTLQAISGAGYPGVASLDILDNVIPHIYGEEDKIENEPLKILGSFKEGTFTNYPMSISAQCNRVAVVDGHMGCISVKLGKKASFDQMIAAFENVKGLSLPSAPKKPLIYHLGSFDPQPKLHRQLGLGMSVSIGQLRPCKLLDWKFVVLSHNTIRGAAGSALLNAEFLVQLHGISSFC